MKTQLLTTEEYLLFVSDEEIKEGYVLCPDEKTVTNVVGFDTDLKKYFVIISGAKCLVDGKDYKKIIGYYPLTPDSKELTGVARLPEWEREEDVVQLAINYHNNLRNENIKKGNHIMFADIKGFLEGYKARADKYSFSLEDMRRCYEGVLQNVGTIIRRGELPTVEQYIQSLSKTTLPKEFIPVEEYFCPIGDTNNYWVKLNPPIELRLKTTLIDNKVVLVGEYKF